MHAENGNDVSNGFAKKDRVATEDKNNKVYEIDCSNSKAVYSSMNLNGL